MAVIGVIGASASGGLSLAVAAAGAPVVWVAGSALFGHTLFAALVMLAGDVVVREISSLDRLREFRLWTVTVIALGLSVSAHLVPGLGWLSFAGLAFFLMAERRRIFGSVLPLARKLMLDRSR